MATLSLLWLVRTTKAASIAAFVVQCSELISHIPAEIKYLWKTRLRFVTCLYVWCRYFPLVAQIISLALSQTIENNPRHNLCYISVILRGVAAQLTTTCVETILMIRVHALYNCSRKTGLFLLAIMVIGTSMEVAGSSMSMMRLQPGPQGTMCIPEPCPIGTLLTFVAGCALIQGTLFVMTVSKIVCHRKTGWIKAPVVSSMLRDGFVIFVTLIIIISGIIASDRLRNKRVVVWNVGYSWYLSLISVVGCRLVLNIRRLTVDEAPLIQNEEYNRDIIQLTSSMFEEDIYFSTPSDKTEAKDVHQRTGSGQGKEL
ncbi:hypothetical protein BDN70DRAFT_934505 [Pholiota conissans]|uniref:DUF6533 domain-containing protein n=1 Tax=Pholiota conissans TaxID=109636 RepID=A0A9P6CY24_9AGAR|nr:hypothetical protein BDN70DRAFT_934505 [Pholiota conissans]